MEDVWIINSLSLLSVKLFECTENLWFIVYPFVRKLLDGWVVMCVCGQKWTPAVLQNKCFQIFIFCFLCTIVSSLFLKHGGAHSLWLTDQWSSTGFFRIGAASSLALLVFLPMVWADMFQLKLRILSLSHRSCSLQCRFCFCRRLCMYLFIMYNWGLCVVLKSNLYHNYPFWVFKFKGCMKANKIICQRSPMLLDQYMRLCGIMVDSV